MDSLFTELNRVLSTACETHNMFCWHVEDKISIVFVWYALPQYILALPFHMEIN
jgi:hypothetical protein